MTFTPYTELTEDWRWQYGTSLNERTADSSSTIDYEDNLIVGGGSSMVYRDGYTDGEFAVIKLDGGNRDELWSWTGTTGTYNHDRVYAVAADGAGDIIAGGMTNGAWGPSETDDGTHDWAAFKLDGDTAEEVWRYQRSFEYNNNDTGWGTILCIGATSQGDAFLVGYSTTLDTSNQDDYQYMMAKVDGTTGEEAWAVQGGSLGSYDFMRGCAVDSRDYLVTAGVSTDALGVTASDTEGSGEAFVAKFDPDGEEVWVYHDGTDLLDEARAVAVDSGDNVYVAGGYEVVHGSYTIANYSTVRKLDGSTGDEIWRYDGYASDGNGCIFYSVTVDESTGIVVAVGQTDGVWEEGGSYSGGKTDFAATVLNATTGEELGRWQDGTGEFDSLYFVGFDSEGSLFMVGETFGAWDETYGDLDFMAVKFAEGGGEGGDGGGTETLLVIWTIAAVAVAAAVLAVTRWCLRVRKRERKAPAKAGPNPAVVAPHPVRLVQSASVAPPPPPADDTRPPPPAYVSSRDGVGAPPPRYSSDRARAFRDFPRAVTARELDRISEAGNTDEESKRESGNGCETTEAPPPYKSLRLLFGRS